LIDDLKPLCRQPSYSMLRFKRCEIPCDTSDDDAAAEMNRKRRSSSLFSDSGFRFPSAPTYFDEMPDFTLQDEKSLSIEQKDDIHKVMLSDMHSWTIFVHMGTLDQEILWLVEMSKIVASKHPFEFIKKHMSWALRAFIDSDKVESVSQLVRLYCHTSNMSTTSEFILKRPFARRKIIQLYCRQIDFEANFLTHSSLTKRREMEIEASMDNYLLHNDCNVIHEVNDICYLVMDDSDCPSKRKYIKISCRVLGYKRTGLYTLYYNVELEDNRSKDLPEDANIKTSPQKSSKTKDEMNHERFDTYYISIERVCPQSLFTSEQYENLINHSY